jgi:hypothetical protein
MISNNVNICSGVWPGKDSGHKATQHIYNKRVNLEQHSTDVYNAASAGLGDAVHICTKQ